MRMMEVAMTIRVSSPEADAYTEIVKRLRRYRAMVANYQACKEMYDQLYPSGTQMLTDMPKGGSESYEVERWADKRWNQSARMERSLDEMRDEYENLERLINTVDGDYNTVLRRRYMLNESWETIAIKMHYERTTVWRWHNKAIEILAKVATPCNTQT